MILDDEDIKLTEWCIPCKKRGYIAVRLLDTDLGPKKSHCEINICTNPQCFRYAQTIPDCWLDTRSKLAYERLRAIYAASLVVHDQRESEKSQRQSHTKGQAHQRAAMDRTRSGIYRLEDARPGRFPRRNERQASGISNHREDARSHRETPVDIKEIPRHDGHSHPVGG